MTQIFNKTGNNIISTVQNNPLAIGGTNLQVTGAMDTKLVALGGFPFWLTIWAAGGDPNTDSTMEVVLATARPSPNNYTITRAQQSTAAIAHSFGANVGLLWTQGNVQDLETAINNVDTNVSTVITNIQNSGYTYAVDSGAANAYVADYTPNITLTQGARVAFKAANANTGSSTLNADGTGAVIIRDANGVALTGGAIVAGMIVEVQYTGVYWQMLVPKANAVVPKFGGTGADGALTASSGATNIDCAGAAIVVKNYTSISLTGTASLTFTNPHANGTTVILKSQGNITITSSTANTIDLRSMGAIGATGAAVGNSAIGLMSYPSTIILGGSNNAGSSGVGAKGTGIVGLLNQGNKGGLTILPGSGGGGVSGSINGGRGGGALYLECGGAYNFGASASINVSGANGTNNTGSGGGGGGAGSILALYASLTADAGTYTATGGTGGTASSPGNAGGAGGTILVGATGNGNGGNGGTVGSGNTPGGGGGAGRGGNPGSDGAGGGANPSGGGGGGGGSVYSALNTEFV